MNNLSNFIVATLVIFVVLGIFWISGGGIYLPEPNSSASVSVSDREVPENDNGTILAVYENEDGRYLVDGQGRALYTTTKEDCSGSCLETWPPYRAHKEVVKGRLSVLGVGGVGVQYTWDSSLLYYYEGDRALGDTNGHELGDVWSLARP